MTQDQLWLLLLFWENGRLSRKRLRILAAQIEESQLDRQLRSCIKAGWLSRRGVGVYQLTPRSMNALPIQGDLPDLSAFRPVFSTQEIADRLGRPLDSARRKLCSLQRQGWAEERDLGEWALSLPRNL